jgi:glutamine synthetase
VAQAPVELEFDADFDERVRETKARLVESGVQYAFATWVDIHGRSKAKFVPIARFDELARGSEAYTVQAFEGMGPLGPHDPDQFAVPDLDSLTICPWDKRLVWMASDIYIEGRPYEYDSRTILRRAAARAREAGYGFMLGIEPEFYVLRRNEHGKIVPYHPNDVGPCWAYDVEATLDSMPLLETLERYVTELGWEMGSFDHEGGHGQYELDFGYADVLTMADRFTFLRLMLKEVAKRHGAFATFMPKPFIHDFRSGAHFNMSFVDADTGENLMRDENDPRGTGFSPLAYSFTAGILRHAGAITAVACPTVNSYKGLISHGIDPTGMARDMSWAPVYMTYGDNNRSAMLRLPNNRPALENRAVDPATNVYWAAAIHVAAGLQGIQQQLDPGDPTNANLYELDLKGLQELGIARLPRTLPEALEAFEVDPLPIDVFGQGPRDAYLQLKKEEWGDFNYHVTEWELERYLNFY